MPIPFTMGIMPRTKFAPTVGLALLLSSAALLVVEACTSSDDGGTLPSVDGGGCANALCLDATFPGSDAASSDGSAASDSSAQNDAGRADAAPNDGGITDAGPQGDADPWTDADTNCAHYADQGSQAVTVRIRNNRTTPIYIGTPTPDCQFHVGFDLFDSADASLTTALQIANRCSDFENNPVCPSSSCQPTTVTKIAPNGGTYDIGWPGTVFDARFMAKSCYADAGCATGPCMQERAAPPADIRVTSYPSYYCDGGTCFDCTNGALTSCTLFGSVGGTSGAPTTSTKAYDGGSGIFIVDVGP